MVVCASSRQRKNSLHWDFSTKEISWKKMKENTCFIWMNRNWYWCGGVPCAQIFFYCIVLCDIKELRVFNTIPCFSVESRCLFSYRRLMGKDNDKFSTSHCKIQIQQRWPRLTRTDKENKCGEKLSQFTDEESRFTCFYWVEYCHILSCF